MWMHPSNQMIEKMSRSNHTILLTGRTGTGKSHMARDIHNLSPRADRVYVAVNLATLNENLIESELFGHEKGAFSGADCKRIGKLEMANGGTVFLDEIGELTPRLQTKLLDALNHKAICAVGSNREIKLDVRIIAATNRDLEKMVSSGSFREDLFYRLNTFQVHLPDLIANPDRLICFAKDFVLQACAEQGLLEKKLSECFLAAVRLYTWPGNVRELKNAIDFAVAISSDLSINAAQLPPYIQQRISIASTNCVQKTDVEFPVEFSHAKEQFERSYLMAMLKYFDGRVNLTARKTKISKVTLIDKIRRYEINLEAIKYENYSQKI